MKSSQKVALSLLVAVIVFSGFTIFAFSGLFHYIEATFYNPRVRQHENARLERAVAAVESYHAKNKIRFEKILEQGSVKSIFQANQSLQDIQSRQALFGAMKSEMNGFMFVRFIGNQGQRLHFSSLPSDVQSSGPGQIEYKPPGEIKDPLSVATLALPQSTPFNLLSVPQDDTFIYRFLVKDSYNIVQGTALFYVSVQGLANELVSDGVIRPWKRSEDCARRRGGTECTGSVWKHARGSRRLDLVTGFSSLDASAEEHRRRKFFHLQ